MNRNYRLDQSNRDDSHRTVIPIPREAGIFHGWGVRL
jgi:hypothetical protein